MKKIFLTIFTLFAVILSYSQNERDWANFAFFAKENATLTVAPRAVFMGNSITQNWRSFHPGYFTEHNYAGRGIGGQVTSQMLCRFRADVIDLHPLVVVILAGTNDIAMNEGYISPEHIMDNIVSMAELAKANDIKVILCSILPADQYKWRSPEFNEKVKPAGVIRDLNARMKAYAAQNDCVYVDFWTHMADANGGLKTECSGDGVHPYPHVYDMMEDMVTPLIEQLAQ